MKSMALKKFIWIIHNRIQIIFIYFEDIVRNKYSDLENGISEQ